MLAFLSDRRNDGSALQAKNWGRPLGGTDFLLEKNFSQILKIQIKKEKNCSSKQTTRVLQKRIETGKPDENLRR